MGAGRGHGTVLLLLADATSCPTSFLGDVVISARAYRDSLDRPLGVRSH
jgi:hypothetical protein